MRKYRLWEFRSIWYGSLAAQVKQKQRKSEVKIKKIHGIKIHHRLPSRRVSEVALDVLEPQCPGGSEKYIKFQCMSNSFLLSFQGSFLLPIAGSRDSEIIYWSNSHQLFLCSKISEYAFIKKCVNRCIYKVWHQRFKQEMCSWNW